MLRTLARCALALLALGCGEYVAYEDGPPVTGPIGDGAGVLDEATRDAFANASRLDHLAFEGLLSRFVTESADGRQTTVDYAGLAASPEARYALAQYLGVLDLVDPANLADGDERLAYWINAYNANVIAGVLATWGGDPGYSVSDADFVFFKNPAYRVAGALLSLDQIEQGVIRGQLDHAAVTAADSALRARIAEWHQQIGADPVDARIHVALNCASLGCPDLPAASPFAYTGPGLAEELDRAARRFIDNPVKGAGPDGVSALLVQFYPGDFEAEYGGWQGFVRAFASDPDAVAYDRVIEYDWTLNVTP